MDLLGELPTAQPAPAPSGAVVAEPAHYPHGPSSAHRWLNCYGSIQAEAGKPDVTGDPADEGTAAHWLLEQCLLNFPTSVADYLDAARDSTQWKGLDDQGLTHAKAGLEFNSIGALIKPGEETGTLKSWRVTGEMREAVQLALDVIDKEASKKGSKLWVESRVRLDDRLELPAPVGGTCDIRCYLPRSKTLYVWDFKYGQGHVVEADNNEQNDLYGLGAVYAFEKEFGGKRTIKKLVRGIIQPRAHHKKGPVRYAKDITPEELKALREPQLIEAVPATLEPDAKRTPGEKQCLFCKAKVDCKEHAEWQAGRAAMEFEAEPEVAGPRPEGAVAVPVTDLPSAMAAPVTSLPANTLAGIYAALPALKKWVAQVEKEVKDRLEEKIEVQGYRLGQGRGSRVWAGESFDRVLAAERLIKAGKATQADLFVPSTLRSPAQIEEAVGKAAFKESPLAAFVSRVEGGAVVVAADSDKPDYVPKGQREFTAEAQPAEQPSHSLLGELPGSHLL